MRLTRATDCSGCSCHDRKLLARGPRAAPRLPPPCRRRRCVSLVCASRRSACSAAASRGCPAYYRCAALLLLRRRAVAQRLLQHVTRAGVTVHSQRLVHLRGAPLPPAHLPLHTCLWIRYINIFRLATSHLLFSSSPLSLREPGSTLNYLMNSRFRKSRIIESQHERKLCFLPTQIDTETLQNY